jgi:hypothetical protein
MRRKLTEGTNGGLSSRLIAAKRPEYWNCAGASANFGGRVS